MFVELSTYVSKTSVVLCCLQVYVYNLNNLSADLTNAPAERSYPFYGYPFHVTHFCNTQPREVLLQLTLVSSITDEQSRLATQIPNLSAT